MSSSGSATDISGEVQHVSDTALCVAYYRALESDRPDALFKDSLARVLVGARGEEIAYHLRKAFRYTQWTVAIRTYIIDRLIESLVAEGVDTVLNLGAGLDTRPYRMDLPKQLRWVEVDHPSIIDHKNSVLAQEKPYVALERVSLDLADVARRDELLRSVGATSKRVLTLTEGVLPYLSISEVESLADSLRRTPRSSYWIAEYFSPGLYPYLQGKQRQEKLKNAPFQFFPADWFGVFAAHGWVARDVRYLPEEAGKLNRAMPLPWWARLLHLFMSEKRKSQVLKSMGYVVFEPSEARHPR